MVYQYVISSNINIFHFQLNINIHPSRPYVTYMSQKNNFLAGEIFLIFFFFFLSENNFNVIMNRNFFWTHISILRFCGVKVYRCNYNRKSTRIV